MSKFVLRPFWSYDVLKTEKWLSDMNNKGYSLKRVKFKSRIFVFEKSEYEKVYYRIAMAKTLINIHKNSLRTNYMKE